MKILVVDDEPVSRKKMEVIMQNFGFCDSARSGEEAINLFVIALASNRPFDVIALDISMPDMDGLGVLLKIREIEKNENVAFENRVKVIMVTSKSDKESVLSSMNGGCNEYIIKPFNWKIIFNKLIKLKVLKLAQ